jgi:hypothetical protein
VSLRIFHREPTVWVGCLYLVKRFLTFAGKISFRVAFGICILFQLILWALLLAAVAHFLPAENYFVERALGAITFIGMFAIGACNHFLFQRMTHAQYVVSESDKWLAQRRQPNSQWRKRRTILKRWALWIPTLTVILVCTFLDSSWAFATHLLHPGRGRLIGYEVRIPISWSIAYSDIGKQGDANTIVVVERYHGLIKAGSSRFLGRQRPFATSNINFRSFPGGERPDSEAATKIVSTRTLPFAKGTIECREYGLPRWMESGHYIRCFTPMGDFAATFDGADEDVAEFYRMLSSVKPL